MNRVNKETTYVFIGEGGRYEIYCRTRLMERGCSAAASEEAMERARELAKQYGHERITVRDVSFDDGKLQTVPTTTAEEVAAIKRAEHQQRLREWRRANESNKLCAMCYVRLRTVPERESFLCKAHSLPAPDDVRNDLMASARLGIVGDGMRVVQGYEEECECSADRARRLWEQGKKYW